MDKPRKTYDSRVADKFVVRMPEGMRIRIEQRALDDDRSMNAVIIRALKQYLGEPSA